MGDATAGAEEPKAGDYQIRIHVIEGRKLASKDDGGTSDPVTKVTCSLTPETRATTVLEKTLNPLWDQTLIFEPQLADASELDMATITIEVWDSDMLGDDIIGTFTVELQSMVYTQKNHEMWRTWLALADAQGNEEGVQGYLKVTINVLGPGDELVTHTPEEERKHDAHEGLSKALMPSTVGQVGHEVTVQIYEARSLAALDSAGIMSDATSDPYITVEFAGAQPVSTNMRKSTCNPRWNEKLVLPVFLPAMQDNLRLTCWDWNATGADEAIGVAELALSAVAEGMWENPRWLHLYGGPTDGSSMRSELANRMNMGLAEGTHYRGSILLCAEDIEEDDPTAVGNTGHGIFGRGRTEELRIEDDYILDGPTTTTWVLWLDVLEGNDLPVEDMASVVVELGQWRAQTSVKRAYSHAGQQSADFRNGRIVWYEMLELRVQLPNDIEQVPDIFISVMHGKQRKSYLRYRPLYPHSTSELQAAKGRKEVLLPIPGNGSFLRDNSRAWGSLRQGKTWMMPKWQFMRLDPFNRTNKEEFAGNLLFAIGFGREVDLPPAPRAQLTRPTYENGRQELYHIRAHIYQARDLPSADENGAADPYVMLRVGGRPYKATRTKFETRFPVWYETLSFDGVPLPSPDDINRNLGPMLTLLVMDQDDSILTDERDGDFLGRVQVASGKVNQANMPVKPTWYPVFSGNTNTTKGQLLMSFQLIPNKLGIENFPAAKLQPPMVRCTIEILLLGARGLLHSSLAKSEPRQLKLSVEGVDLAKGSATHVSKMSNQPTQCDPNWLERINIQANLPIEEPMFLPVINVSVLEAAFFGMSERTLSTCAIDLATFCSTFKRAKPSLPSSQRALEEQSATTLQQEIQHNPTSGNDPRRRSPRSDLERELDPEFEMLVPNDPVGGTECEKTGSSEGDLSEREDSSEEDGSTVSQQAKSKSFLCFRKSVGADIPLEEMTYDQQQEAKAKALEIEQAAIEERNRSKRRAAKTLPNFDTDTYDLSEPWTVGRAEYDDELEDVIQCAPFQQWTLMAGQSKGDGSPEQPAGQLKARITISSTSEFTHSSTENWWNEFIDERGAGVSSVDSVKTKAAHYASVGDFSSAVSTLKKLPESCDVLKLLALTYTAARDFVSAASTLDVALKLQPNDADLVALKDDVIRKGNDFKDHRRIVQAFAKKKPEALLCRVYIISATGLASRDSGGGADPYLKLRLGRKEINDSKNRRSDTLNPEFRSMYEFQFGLPGEALLHIEVYDWDMLGYDEMVGATTVDLENRWFSQAWLDLGKGNRTPHKRPVELRTLHVPGRRAPQGKLKLWVDILPHNEVKMNPQVPIKRPDSEVFELRVCIFRGRRLPLMDSGDMADYYCSVGVDGTNDDDSQSKFHLKADTDTHFRAKHRRATWNWRLKFEISGPVRNARLSLQCYDFDVIGASDLCGEWMFTDLTAMIARAVGRWRADKRGTPHIVTFPAFHGKRDREWVRLSNEDGKPAGEIEIQMQLVHKDLCEQHPAGEGRAAPNANPKLHDPQDRMSMNFIRPDQILADMVGDELMKKLYCTCACLLILSCSIPVFPLVMANFIQGFLPSL